VHDSQFEDSVAKRGPCASLLRWDVTSRQCVFTFEKTRHTHDSQFEGFFGTKGPPYNLKGVRFRLRENKTHTILDSRALLRKVPHLLASCNDTWPEKSAFSPLKRQYTYLMLNSEKFSGKGSFCGKSPIC